MLEDRYLLRRLKRGDPEALRGIYNRYETDLLSLARGLLGAAGPAEDVLQDVFVKFIESIGTFVLTGSLKSYLAKCVVNRARDYHRMDRHRARAAATNGRSHSTDFGLAPSPAEAVAVDEQRRQVATALTELPDEQRETVLLHLHAGLRFREIARIQGVSVKTAWSRYRYGLDKLRSILNGQVER